MILGCAVLFGIRPEELADALCDQGYCNRRAGDGAASIEQVNCGFLTIE
jgi:hypothetical protein